MDASQISIKINQTPQPISGKTKPNVQSNFSDCSFDQIFAMIYSIHQSGNTNGELEALATENDPVMQDLSKLATGNLSPEDMEKLEAILASLLIAMQQSPNSIEHLQNQPLLQTATSVVDSFQEENDSLVHGIQMNKGANQMDPKQLIHELTQLLNEVSTKEDKNLSDLVPNIKSELQKIIDSINHTKDPVSSGDKLKNNPITIPTELILDKNQVIFSNIKEPTGKSVKNAIRTATVQLEIQTKIDSQPPVIVPSVQVHGGLNETKTVQTSPTVSISEFTPEVSELIGRYFKITNGGSGSTEAKFSLYPDHLGPVEVKIVTQQGLVSAQIITNTSVAKDALEGQLQQLREVLQQQGIVVQKLEITYQPQSTTGSNESNLSTFQNGTNSSNEQRNHSAPNESSKDSSKYNQSETEKESPQLSYWATTSKATSSIDFNA
ncbi:MAG: flagellar hook-length control protein [Bacillales bacterium]|nr:flagellar hook-length control protein [Bacillales bacterium]